MGRTNKSLRLTSFLWSPHHARFRGDAAGGVEGKFYGQAERAISNGKLNVLLRLHIRPINVVVFHGPY